MRVCGAGHSGGQRGEAPGNIADRAKAKVRAAENRRFLALPLEQMKFNRKYPGTEVLTSRRARLPSQRHSGGGDISFRARADLSLAKCLRKNVVASVYAQVLFFFAPTKNAARLDARYGGHGARRRDLRQTW